MENIKDKIINYGMLALIFLTPIVYFGDRIIPHITSHTFFFYGFANMLIGFWLYCVLSDKSYRLSKKQLLIFIPLFLYITWMTISGILAVNPSLAFWSSLMRGTGLLTLYYSTGIALIIASLVKKNGISYLYLVLKSFVLTSFIVALSVWFGDEGFHIQTNFFIKSSGGGLLGNSSLAATYLIFSFFSGIYLLFAKNISKMWKWIISLILITIIFSPLFINIYGFITGHSLVGGHNILGSARAAFLGIFVGVGFTTLGYLSLSKNKTIKILGILGILISLAIFSIGWSQLMKPNTAIHDKFVEVASGNRLIFWDVAKKSIDRHPYFGYGPENYSVAFQENFNPKILIGDSGHETWNDRAHNIYYDTGVSGGYPAILVYTLFLLSIFYAVYNAYKKDKISQIQASILGGLLVAYIFQILFIFDFLLSILSLFMIAGLFYGLFYDNTDKLLNINKNIKKEEKDKKEALNIVIGVLLFIVFVPTWFYFSILPAKKANLFATVLSMPINEISSNYERLLEGSPVGNDWDVGGFAHDTYKFYAKDPVKIKENKSQIPFYEKDLLADIAYLEKVAEKNKTDYRLSISIIHLYSTYIYLIDKPYDTNFANHMLDILKHAHLLSPKNPEVYWGMAQVYAWKGDLNGIIDSYKKGIEIDSSIPASHRLLIKFLGNIGNQKLYNEYLLKAEKDIPGFKLEVSPL